MRRVLAGASALVAVMLPLGALPASAAGTANVKVLSTSSYADSFGDHYIVGEVQNTSGHNLDYVKISVDYYDASNRLLGTDFAYTELEALGVNEKSPFEIMSQTPAGYDHYTITGAAGDITTDYPNHRFTVTVTNDTTGSFGDETIVGQVTNSNTTASDFVKVVFTFYDASHNVTDVDYTYVNGSGSAGAQVGPGQTVSYQEMRDASRAYATRAVAVESSTPPSGPPATPRSTENACPKGQAPDPGFTDVPSNDPHKTNVNCIAWWNITKGKTATTYDPAGKVQRDQMASFLARLVRDGKSLPSSNPNAFDDDQGDVHESDINALAAQHIVTGTGSRTFSPGAATTRGVMAQWIVRAVDYVSGTTLTASHDYFPDDNGSPYEMDINAAAEVGIVSGYTDGTYRPGGNVQRDQMASYIARALDWLVANGYVASHT